MIFTHHTKVRMYDTDTAQILFFGNQYRFMNDALEDLLAEEGLTNETIMAITGHGSAKMVNHYCAAAAQRRRAADAIKAMNKKEAA